MGRSIRTRVKGTTPAWAGLLLTWLVTTVASAQNNAIFSSGGGDGHAMLAAAQTITTAGIFTSGAGDGFTLGGMSQTFTTAGIFSSGGGDGFARDGFSPPITTTGIFTSGAGDGSARNDASQAVTTAGIFSSGSGDGHARNAFVQQFTTVGIFTSGTGDGYARNSGGNVKVSIQGMALLDGPWNAGTQLMGDGLRTSGLVPLTEPYSALGYANTGGSGGESTTPGVLAVTGAGAVVDWVRVELRTAGTPTTLVAVRHALLIRSGAIIDPMTSEDAIELNAPAGNYHVVVRHRNHLGVMSAEPIALSSLAMEIDFSSTATATFGTTAQKTIGTRNVLWAGDVTGNHQIKYTGSGNDRDPILVAVGSTTPNNILTGQYDPRDVNLDGTVKYTGSGNDRDPILVNVGSTAPNNTRTEQVP